MQIHPKENKNTYEELKSVAAKPDSVGSSCSSLGGDTETIADYHYKYEAIKEVR